VALVAPGSRLETKSPEGEVAPSVWGRRGSPLTSTSTSACCSGIEKSMSGKIRSPCS
jgi:hypothetical protein